jgi:predicted O-methyltransferase YrrM
MTTTLIVLVLLLSLASAALVVLLLREVRRLRADVREVDDPAARLAEAVATLREANLRQHRETRATTDALFSLAGLGPTGATQPSTQGWSASPMVLRQLAEQVAEHAPSLVVEIGGGGSSVLLGRLLRKQGHGRVVSLEHDPSFADITRAHLRRHGLEDLVEVRVAPLTDVEVDGETFRWYSPDALADLTDIDIVFVDGPPGSTGRHARFPAVPLLKDRCRPGALVLLDDGARPQERGVADRWIAGYGAIEVSADSVGTGWIQLRLDG